MASISLGTVLKQIPSLVTKWAVPLRWVMLGSIVAATAWGAHQIDAGIVARRDNKILNEAIAKQNQAIADRLAAEIQRDKNAVLLERATDSIHSLRRRANQLEEAENAKPVYTQCIMPDDGLRRLNARIAESNARRQSSGTIPH